MNNNWYFPGELQSRHIRLSDLGEDNRSIHQIYEFRRAIKDEAIKRDLDNVLRLACDHLCTICLEHGVDSAILDYWDGRSEFIVTPFDPSI